MARQYWVAPLSPFHTADGAANASAVLTEISPRPPIILPGQMLEAGSRLEFSAFGRYTSTATQGTLTIGIYLGTSDTIASGQAAILSGTITPQASQTNRTWRLEGNASIRTVGTGTGATLIGCLEISNISTNGTDLAPATAPTTFAFDSTVSNFLKLGMTASVSTGSWTCHYFGARLVN